MNRDPGAAHAWMRALADPVKRRRVEDIAISQIISNDPVAGLKAAGEMAMGQRRFTRTVEALGAWARQDPSSARAAAEALPPGYQRQSALAAVAGSLAASNTAAAAAMLPSLDWKNLTQSSGNSWIYTDAENKRRSSGGSGYPPADLLVDQLVKTDPRAAADALASLPEESGAPLTEIVQKWAGTQPEAASRWLRDLPAGPARDHGIQGLTYWLVAENPEPDYPAALAWAADASPEWQSIIYTQTLQHWHQKDPQAAAAAIAGLPVSPEIRENLERRFR